MPRKKNEEEPTADISLTIAAYNLGEANEAYRERYRLAVKKELEKRYPSAVVAVDVHVNRGRSTIFEDEASVSGKDEDGERISRRTVLGIAQDVWNEGGW